MKDVDETKEVVCVLEAVGVREDIDLQDIGVSVEK